MTKVIKISTRPHHDRNTSFDQRHEQKLAPKTVGDTMPTPVGSCALKAVVERTDGAVDFFHPNRWDFARYLSETIHAIDETAKRTGNLCLASEFITIQDEVHDAREHIAALSTLALHDMSDTTVEAFAQTASELGVNPAVALRAVTQQPIRPQS